MKQLEARKLNTFLTKRVDTSYKTSPQLHVTFSGPQYVGAISSDANRDSLSMAFQSRKYVARDVYVVANHPSDYLNVYFDSQTKERDPSRDDGVLFICRDSQGKRHVLTGPARYGDANARERFIERVFALGGEIQEETRRAILKAAWSRVSDDLLSDQYLGRDALEFLDQQGVKVEKVMGYSHCFSVTPRFISQDENSFEMGWESFGTYASHPYTLKIEHALDEIEHVRLVDLNCEVTGYYDHSRRHVCTPQDAKALKAFAYDFHSKAAESMRANKASSKKQVSR